MDAGFIADGLLVAGGLVLTGTAALGLVRTASAGFLAVGAGAIGAATFVHVLLSLAAHRVLLALTASADGSSAPLGGPYLHSLLLAMSQPTLPAIALLAVCLVLCYGADRAVRMGMDVQVLLQHFSTFDARKDARDKKK